MVEVVWKGRRVFEAVPPSGNRFRLDAYSDSGGSGAGPTPLEALIASLAACSAMDVLHILEKKKQHVDGYRVEVDGERSPEGTYPRPYVSLTIRHVVEGDVDPFALAQAVRLSDEKYCSVAATLRLGPAITSEWVVRAPALAGKPK